MPRFYQLFLAIVGHRSASGASAMTHAAPAPKAGAGPRRRGRRSQAPPVFRGDNRLRRDIGLPPLDERGLPL